MFIETQSYFQQHGTDNPNTETASAAIADAGMRVSAQSNTAAEGECNA